MGNSQSFVSVAILFISLIAVNNCANAENKLELTQQDNGREITVKIGDIIQIELKSFGSAGYMWKFDNFNTNYLELLQEETKRTTKERGITGAPVFKIWKLKAKKKGNITISLYYYRGWESKHNAKDSFTIQLTIL